MFSQTPERQAATHRDAARRDANPRRSAAKGFTEVGKTVIEHSTPTPAIVAPQPAVIDMTPAVPDGSDARDEIEDEAAEVSPDE